MHFTTMTSTDVSYKSKCFAVSHVRPNGQVERPTYAIILKCLSSNKIEADVLLQLVQKVGVSQSSVQSCSVFSFQRQLYRLKCMAFVFLTD
jgi:hypothetical protein